MSNPFMNMSPAERERQKAMLEQAMKADEATRLVVHAKAFKKSYDVLKSAGVLTERLLDIPQQAFPREALLAKPADLSESQIQALKDGTEKALDSVKL